eukprot:g27897.t1
MADGWRTPCSTVASRGDLQLLAFQVGDRVKMQPEKALNGQFHAVTSVCTNATAYLQLDFHGLQKDDIVA